MTIKVGAEEAGLAGKNTVGERKLLFFELTGRRAFQNCEARLSGARDGKWCGKFRGIYNLCRDPADGLPARGARLEFRRLRRRAVLEPIAAQAAGSGERGVGVERHRRYFTTP